MTEYTKTDAGFVCRYEFPDIHWPSRRGGKKKKTPLNQPPTGTLVSVLFGWNGWSNGKMAPDVKVILSDLARQRDPSDGFRALCKKVCCGQCKEYSRCTRWKTWYVRLPSPLKEDLSDLAYLWSEMTVYQRRALTILTLMGTRGMRGGGYRERDLHLLFGGSLQNVRTLANRFAELGIIKKAGQKYQRRYYFRPQMSEGKLARETDAYWRKYAQHGGQFVLKMTRKRRPFKEDTNYRPLSQGVFVGKLPPKCYVDYARIFEALMTEVWDYTIGRALEREQRLSRKERDALNGIQQEMIGRVARRLLDEDSKGFRSRSGPDMVADDYEDVARLLERTVAELAGMESSITRRDLDDWSEYLGSISHNPETGKREGESWIISDIDPMGFV